MSYHCINDKFNYCSTTPDGNPTGINPATGEQTPGFEFENGSCTKDFKTCRLHRNWIDMYAPTLPPVPVTEAEKAVLKEVQSEQPVLATPQAVAVPAIVPKAKKKANGKAAAVKVVEEQPEQLEPYW